MAVIAVSYYCEIDALLENIVWNKWTDFIGTEFI